MKPLYNPGYIYFLKSHDLLKVGFTNNPKRRISTHKGSNPHIEVLAVVISYQEVETLIHLKYEAIHNREWYKINDYLNISQDVTALTTKIVMGDLI